MWNVGIIRLVFGKFCKEDLRFFTNWNFCRGGNLLFHHGRVRTPGLPNPGLALPLPLLGLFPPQWLISSGCPLGGLALWLGFFLLIYCFWYLVCTFSLLGAEPLPVDSALPPLSGRSRTSLCSQGTFLRINCRRTNLCRGQMPSSLFLVFFGLPRISSSLGFIGVHAYPVSPGPPGWKIWKSRKMVHFWVKMEIPPGWQNFWFIFGIRPGPIFDSRTPMRCKF